MLLQDANAQAPSQAGSASASQQAEPSIEQRQPVLPYDNPFLRPLDQTQSSALDPESRRIDSLQTRLLSEISALYRLQSQAIDAQLAGDYLEAETRLMEAVDGVQALLQAYPALQENRRFAEAYRSVMSEYREFYGISFSEGQVEGEVFSVMQTLMEEDDLMPEETFILPDELRIPKTDVPLIQNSHVSRHLIYYTMRRPDVMEKWLDRSTVYFPMMEKIFMEERVPVELIHLSMIESGLVPTARSWAAAVGLWQFIQATGAMYGLEVNWWIDERRDPEKATRAAARHLRDLYNIWGDWHLAMANYNISPRGLRRAINAAGGKEDYWEAYPYLPRETRGYVPGFIAATMIAMSPEDFGFAKPEPSTPYRYDVAQVGGLMSLDQLALAAGIPVNDLKELNPELLRWATPPGASYPLKIPYGTKSAFIAAYEQLPKDERVSEIAMHTVRSGENLGLIARKYGTTVRALYSSNENLSSTIYPGQKIAVPVAPGPAEQLAVNLPTHQATSINTSRPAQVQAPANTTPVTYTVKPNDTIGHIAEWFDVAAWQIRTWNGIGNTIRVGQKLTLHVPRDRTAYYTQVNTRSFSEKQTLERRQKNGENIFAGFIDSGANGEELVYTVKRSDTLTEIARSFGVTVSSIQQTNNLKSTVIYPGQQLTIRR